MTLLLGVVLILGVILWNVDSHLEWNIPLKWQAFLKAWTEKLGSKTHKLKYIWYLGSENSELEKQFWHLKMALPRLRKKFRVPLWIEVRVDQRAAPRQIGKYIACLQRRFPEIEIQEERGIYELFPDRK